MAGAPAGLLGVLLRGYQRGVGPGWARAPPGVKGNPAAGLSDFLALLPASGRILLPAEAVQDRCDDTGLLDHCDSLHPTIAPGASHDISREHLQGKLLHAIHRIR